MTFSSLLPRILAIDREDNHLNKHLQWDWKTFNVLSAMRTLMLCIYFLSKLPELLSICPDMIYPLLWLSPTACKYLNKIELMDRVYPLPGMFFSTYILIYIEANTYLSFKTLIKYYRFCKIFLNLPLFLNEHVAP